MRNFVRTVLSLALLTLVSSCVGETTTVSPTPPSLRKVSRNEPFKPVEEVLITVYETHIFAEPTHVSDPVVKVKEGNKVRVIEDRVGPRGLWTRVECDGRIGFVRRSCIVAWEHFAPVESLQPVRQREPR